MIHRPSLTLENENFHFLFSHQAPTVWNQLPVSVHHASYVNPFKILFESQFLLTNFEITLAVDIMAEQAPKNKKNKNKPHILVQFYDINLNIWLIDMCVCVCVHARACLSTANGHVWGQIN